MTPRELEDLVWFAACSPTEKLVMLCLRYHGTPSGKRIYPGVRRITALTGLARSTVETAIATLIGRNFLRIVEHGNSTKANLYEIGLAALMEHPIPTTPPLRGHLEGVPATGTPAIPATGTPTAEGVPMEGREVSRPTPEGVPAIGTEQTTNITTNNYARALWLHALPTLRSADPGRRYLWDKLAPVTLDGLTLTLSAPDLDAVDLAEAQAVTIYAALDSASATTGHRYERLTIQCSTPTPAEHHAYPTLSPPPRYQYRRPA